MKRLRANTSPRCPVVPAIGTAPSCCRGRSSSPKAARTITPPAACWIFGPCPADTSCHRLYPGLWCICGQKSALHRRSAKITLVRDGKRLEIRHLGFTVCGSSIRQGVFAGPKSLDAPEPSACDPSKPGACGTFNYLVFSQVLGGRDSFGFSRPRSSGCDAKTGLTRVKLTLCFDEGIQVIHPRCYHDCRNRAGTPDSQAPVLFQTRPPAS